jgi:hypothetical protein
MPPTGVAPMPTDRRVGTATHAVPVLRGRSRRPLYITAAGMPVSHGNAELAVHPVALGCGADPLVPSGVASGDRWAGLPAPCVALRQGVSLRGTGGVNPQLSSASTILGIIAAAVLAGGLAACGARPRSARAARRRSSGLRRLGGGRGIRSAACSARNGAVRWGGLLMAAAGYGLASCSGRVART